MKEPLILEAITLLSDAERALVFEGMDSDETIRWFAKWSNKLVNDLPDSSFLYVEKGKGVTKDDDGKTMPRSARHLPIKDADGNVDVPHVRAALSRLGQESTGDNADADKWLTSSLRESLTTKAQKLLPSSKSMSALETVTLERVPVLSEGGPYFGQGSPPDGDYYSKADLEEIVAANRELAEEVRPANKLGHSKEQTLLSNSGISLDEQPAAGWLDPVSMEVAQAADGKWKIFTDILKVPAKLAKLFEAGAYRTRSVELSRIRSQSVGGAEDGTEKVFENVITGLAWLGAKAPAVRTLEDVFAFYGEAVTETKILTWMAEDEASIPSEVTRTIEYVDATAASIVWQPETGFQDLMCDLRAALNPSGGSTRYWVSDVAIDLKSCIVNDWEGNTTWIVPFKVDDSGDPVVSAATEWQEAEQAWVAATDELAEKNFGEGVQKKMRAAYTEAVSDKAKKLANTSDEQVAELAKTFSLEGDTPEALRDAVAGHLETLGVPVEAPAAADPVVPTPAPAAGTVSMSETEATELRTNAELGARAFEERRIESREALITSALGANGGKTKILPGQADDWRKFYDAQPELAKAQMEALPELQIRTFGLDDTVDLPADVKPEDVERIGDDAYARYADQTGVPRQVTVA